VAERLYALTRFREAKPRLSVAQSARAVGYPQSALYAWENRLDGDQASLADRSQRRKTARRRTARVPELRTAVKDMRTSFAWGNEKLW